MNLVNAQQARRVLDRLVGFELSPLLWKKVRPQLSAGRVQSVAVRLLVEREREIIAFRSTPYYRVVAQFYAAADPDKTLFKGGTVHPLRYPRGSRDFPAQLHRRPVHRRQSRGKTGTALPRASVHDLDAPAGGGPQTRNVGIADDVRGAAPLRAGFDYLHAYRLGKSLEAGDRPVQGGDHQTFR